LKSLGVSFEELKSVVAGNDKQRFSLILNPEYNTQPGEDELPAPDNDNPSGRGRVPQPQLPLDANPSAWLIRANQGHSIVLDSSSLLQPLTLNSPSLPEVVLHGTFYGAWGAILSGGGMSKMGRNHMHFAAGVPGQDAGVISGMRADAQILIYIDIRRALDAGLPFWLSDNGVILTEGDNEGMLSLEFFVKVVDRKRDVVLWEDGEVVNELPAGLRNQAPPRGKGKQRQARGEKSRTPSSSRSEGKQRSTGPAEP
jgi:2'-phosphotransferase